MKKIAAALLIILWFSSFDRATTLKGAWEFKGGIYNGKKEAAPTGYTLRRIYDADKFDAFLIENGEQTQKYQSGNYQLEADTCRETETYSAQPSKLTGKPMKYLYTIHVDTLILQGTLPSGMLVQEYWKKVK
jgi:hypothetical protein